jgi:hypothetical protein
MGRPQQTTAAVILTAAQPPEGEKEDEMTVGNSRQPVDEAGAALVDWLVKLVASNPGKTTDSLTDLALVDSRIEAVRARLSGQNIEAVRARLSGQNIEAIVHDLIVSIRLDPPKAGRGSTVIRATNRVDHENGRELTQGEARKARLASYGWLVELVENNPHEMTYDLLDRAAEEARGRGVEDQLYPGEVLLCVLWDRLVDAQNELRQRPARRHREPRRIAQIAAVEAIGGYQLWALDYDGSVWAFNPGRDADAAWAPLPDLPQGVVEDER